MQSKNSIRAVNILLLIVLCLETANLFFTWLPQYVRLILNEALFVFLPAYLYLRITRQPVAERVRWSWPGWGCTRSLRSARRCLPPCLATRPGLPRRMPFHHRRSCPSWPSLPWQ